MTQKEKWWSQHLLRISKRIKSNYLTLSNGVPAGMTAKAIWVKIHIHAPQTISIHYLLVAATTYSSVQWQTTHYQLQKWYQNILLSFCLDIYIELYPPKTKCLHMLQVSFPLFKFVSKDQILMPFATWFTKTSKKCRGRTIIYSYTDVIMWSPISLHRIIGTW